MKFNLHTSRKFSSSPKKDIKSPVDESKSSTILAQAIRLQKNSLIVTPEQAAINLHLIRTRKLCNGITGVQSKLIANFEKLGSALFSHSTLTDSGSSLHSPSSQGGFSSHLGDLEKKIGSLSNSIQGQQLDLASANLALVKHAPLPDDKSEKSD